MEGVTIEHAVIFTLLSLLFAGINDVIFKKYSVETLSRGMYFCGAGLVWTAIQGTIVLINNDGILYNSPTLKYGLAAGIVLCLSNILLLEGLKHLDVSIGSTIYRLNTVGVVILSVLILKEPIAWIKGMGIILGILGVLLLYESREIQTKKNHLFIFFLVVILASFLRACYGVIIKAGILKHANPQFMLIFVSSCWIIGGLLYAVLKEKMYHLDRQTALYSGVSGVMVFFIVFFLTCGLQYGEATVVIPIANMSFVIALGIAAFIGMEDLTWKKGTSIVLASAAIVCLSVS